MKILFANSICANTEALFAQWYEEKQKENEYDIDLQVLLVRNNKTKQIQKVRCIPEWIWVQTFYLTGCST